jgi:hypothetical protein
MRQTFTALMVLLLAACGSKGPEEEEPDPCPSGHETDFDEDNINDADEGCNELEGPVDTDGDTVPDYQDEDSDGDGLSDGLEAGDTDAETPPYDSDGDGTADFRDLDSDDNGIPDEIEGWGDPDRDGSHDFTDRDNDGDYLSDVLEIGDPSDPTDFDGDGIYDYNDTDSDDDTITDTYERDEDQDGDTIPDYHDLDTDGDGIDDADEAGDDDPSTAPVDTDGDGTADYRDLDSDNDGLPDEDEVASGTDRLVPDSDGDGVSDFVEIAMGSDPLDDTSDPRTLGLVFVMFYNGPGTTEDLVRAPDPTMDTVVLVTGSTGPVDVTFELRDDPSDSVDTLDRLIDVVQANPTGGVADPRDPTRICASGLSTLDTTEPPDGRPDTYTSVPADTAVCFDVNVNYNWHAPSCEDPQTFLCEIDLVEVGGGVLDTQNIYLLVPPGEGPCP